MVLLTAAVVAALVTPPAAPSQPMALRLSIGSPTARRAPGIQAVLAAPVVLDNFPRVELKLGKFIMKSVGVGAHYRLLPWVALGGSSNVVKPGPGQPLALQLVGLLHFRF
ncbi:MAG TPA: hypothetical protein VFH73_04220 [Polyangia bacterium]|jgi:hypothetical protein|nr:hypothetical protein [Polyangia bacterium]